MEIIAVAADKDDFSVRMYLDRRSPAAASS